MRLYTFGNVYLSSAQQGIQAAHVVAELFVKYQVPPYPALPSESPAAVLYDWATHHKTMICLNGGNHQGLIETSDKFAELALKLELPYARFFEDEQSLGGILTCYGVVVPTKVYELAAELRKPNDVMMFSSSIQQATPTELELAARLNQYSLAR